MVLSETIFDGNISQEFLLNGVHGGDVIDVFEPLLKIQSLLGSSRVNIKDGSVSTPSKFHKCYTAICFIIMSISVMQLILTYKIRFYDNRKMFYLWVVGILSLEIIFAGFLIYARFCDNEGNIRLYQKMQEIDRMVPNITINVMLQKHNRKTTYSLVLFFAILFIATYIIAKDEFGILELIASVYTFEVVVFELCCCSSHIRFFYTRVRQLNTQLGKLVERKTCFVAVLSKGSEVDRFVQVSANEQEYDFETADIYLKEIFTGFILFKELYRFQMFIFCSIFIVFVIFIFEDGILTLQFEITDKSMLLADFYSILFVILLYVLLLIWLSCGTETFMREVRETKHLSILIMCHYVEGPLRRTAKNMLDLIEETPPSFSVYGMWTMDAKFMIDIFQLITNFILTIIQFTFL